MTSGEQRGRAAAILLLVAVVTAAIAAVLVPAVLHWKALGGQIVTARERLANAAGNQRGIDALVNSGAVWRDFSRSPDAGVIQAADADAAQEMVRSRLASLVEAQGGTLSDSNVLMEDTGEAPATRIRGEVTAQLDAAALPGLLFALESEPPYMVLDRITVSDTGEDSVKVELGGVMFRFDPKAIEQ